MANPHRGEVAFEAGGKTRILRMGANEQCALEAEFDLGIMRILAHLELGRMTDIRQIFRGILVGGASLEEAGEIIDQIGGYMVAAELLARASQLAFPPAEAANGKNPPPVVPAKSTGTDSLSNGSPPEEAKTAFGPRPSGKSGSTAKQTKNASTTNSALVPG